MKGGGIGIKGRVILQRSLWVTRQFNGGKNSLLQRIQQILLGQLDMHMQKNKTGSLIKLYTKINSKLIDHTPQYKH